MPYKYQAQLDAIPLTKVLCPCQKASPREGVAYRFAHLPAANPANFLPRPLEGAPPPRRINITPSSTKEEIIEAETTLCDLWGISLFETPEAATQLFKAINRKRQLLTQTHIAELTLSPADGDCTPVDRNRHFNLHESEDACLSNNVRKALPIQ
jgi:hypothetical protein